MKNELLERGYSQIEEKNEFIKGDWTIRYDDVDLEAFNSIDIREGRYFYSAIDKVDLEVLLDEIDEFLLD